jgi:hypothetical protein
MEWRGLFLILRGNRMNNIKDIHKLAGLISPADLEILDEAAALHKKKYLIFDLNTPHLIFINLA